MAQTSEITERLATRLKEERAARGLSLEALAGLSGVSRSMLSQIERGESSPTVASLWHLTRALGLDFSGLLDAGPDAQSPILQLMRSGAVPVMEQAENGVTIRILSPPEDVGATEVYELIFAQGGHLTSPPHKAGCTEILTVLDGTLDVSSGDAQEALSTGDTIRYRADLPHRIAAPGAAKALLVVKNP